MSKELSIDYVNVRDVVFGKRTELQNGVLTLDKEELLNMANKPIFDSFDVKIASPGDSCRILGVHDVTQPRCKAAAPETSYPGVWGSLTPAGEGKTVALRGVVITELYYPKANVKWYLDMCQPCSEYSYYARHHHVILDAPPGKGISDATYIEALKHSALSINVHLAKLAVGQTPDKTETFSHHPLEDGKKLPRVAYLCTLHATTDFWNFLYYGQSAIGYLPIVVQPTEILDGGVVFRYWENTYVLQNEPYVKELLSRHGKDLDFAGVVFANNTMRIGDKSAMGLIAAGLCKHTLRSDCVMVNKSGMGHAQLDAAMTFNWCETMGMTSALNLAGVSNDTPGDMLVIADPKVDAVVNSGRHFLLDHPKVERVIGEGANVPSLLGINPRGPFTHTTNYAYMGVYGQLGDCYRTMDDDVTWTAPEARTLKAR
jgi:glycine reductase